MFSKKKKTNFLVIRDLSAWKISCSVELSMKKSYITLGPDLTDQFETLQFCLWLSPHDTRNTHRSFGFHHMIPETYIVLRWNICLPFGFNSTFCHVLYGEWSWDITFIFSLRLDEDGMVGRLITLLRFRFTYEPAHDKTYNKTCYQRRLRSASKSTQHGKGSRLSLIG